MRARAATLPGDVTSPPFAGALLLITGLPLALLMAVAPVAGLVALGAGLAAFTVRRHHRTLLSWRWMLGGVVLLVVFVPIRRYVFPGAMPFDLEPYRVAVAAVLVAWGAALLVQPETRLRRIGVGPPLLCVVLAFGLSVAVNAGGIDRLGVEDEVVKRLTFFLSFAALTVVVASVCVNRRDIESLLALLVGGGAILAVLAIVESRTGYNVFDHLHGAVPFLDYRDDGGIVSLENRGGRLRIRGSAQHPIALGAALVLLVPLGLYLAHRRRRAIWWVACGVLVLAALATVSRTSVLMLLVEIAILVAVKPAATRPLWPLLIPLLAVVHIATPGVLGGFKSAFFPTGGLVAEQSKGAGSYGSGRLADIGPGLRELSRQPILGQGFGTRITNRSDPKHNAPILDNEWLGLSLQTGVAGLVAMLWLFARAIRRLASRARGGSGAISWLAAGLAASIGAFAAGMLTYDAFSFVQVTFLLFLLLGVAGAALRLEDDREAPGA